MTYIVTRALRLSEQEETHYLIPLVHTDEMWWGPFFHISQYSEEHPYNHSQVYTILILLAND